MAEKVKVTVIDDEKDLVEIIRQFLETRNFEVSTAYGGVSGLEVIRKERPDVIVLDILMPDLDGRDMLVKLKKDNATRDIPVIILTGKEEQYDRTYLLELGAYEFVPKPYNGQILLRQINNILDKRQKGKL